MSPKSSGAPDSLLWPAPHTAPERNCTANSLILITCNQGTSDVVMETAKKAGARGGTVFRGRLSGVEELESSYSLNMTHEKEILMIIVPNDIRNAVMECINQAHGLRSEAEAVCCLLTSSV